MSVLNVSSTTKYLEGSSDIAIARVPVTLEKPSEDFAIFVLRAVLILLCLFVPGLTSITAANADDNAPVEHFFFGAGFTSEKNFISVSASDGKTYNIIEPDALPMYASADMLFKRKSGEVGRTGIYLGNCSNSICGSHPMITFSSNSSYSENWPRKWYWGAAERDKNYRHHFNFDTSRIPVTNAQGIAPIPQGDTIVGRCNELKSANRAGNFSFDIDVTFSISANTRTGVLEDLSTYDQYDDISDIEFNGGDQNKQHDVRFEVRCGALENQIVAGGNQGLVLDHGEIDIKNINLTLETYSDAYTELNPGTRCKKAKLRVVAEANQKGAVPLTILTLKEGEPIETNNTTRFAIHDNGRFFATYEEWIEVDKDTFFQARASAALQGDGFPPETAWEGIHLSCDDFAGGGLQTELAPLEMSGTLSIDDPLEEQPFPQCPRSIGVAIEIQASRHGWVDRRLTCNALTSDTVQKFDLYKLNGTPWNESFTHHTKSTFGFVFDPEVSPQQLVCALSGRHSSGGPERILAVADKEIQCATQNPELPPPDVDGLSADLPPLELIGKLDLIDPAEEQQFASCPRKIKIKPVVQANRHGSTNMRVTCNGEDDLSQVELKNLFDTSKLTEAMTHGTDLFFSHIVDVDKSEKLMCALSADHSGGEKERLLALETLDVSCSNKNPDLAGDVDGLASPDKDDDNGLPPAKPMTGGFAYIDNSDAAKRNECERSAKALVWFDASKSDNIHYSLDCGALGNFSGVLQPTSIGNNRYRAGKLVPFQIDKTIEAGCTLRTVSPGSPTDHAFKAKTFQCFKTAGHSSTSDLTAGSDSTHSSDDSEILPEVCIGGKIRYGVCFCPDGTKREKIGDSQFECKIDGIATPTKPATKTAPVRTTPEQPKPEIAVCKGGKIKNNKCLCPANAKRKKISRFEYVCKKPNAKIVDPTPKKLVCVGGKVREGKCTCGLNKTRKKVGNRKFQCIAVAQPPKPKKKKLLCAGGKVRNGKCKCGPNKIRKKLGKRKFQCLAVAKPVKKKKPVLIKPKKKKKKAVRVNSKPKKRALICKGGKIRGNRCKCPKGKVLRKQGKRKFLCFRPAG